VGIHMLEFFRFLCKCPLFKLLAQAALYSGFFATTSLSIIIVALQICRIWCIWWVGVCVFIWVNGSYWCCGDFVYG
jgi:hypothetical protein